MIELVICEEIRKGYKIILPKNTNVRLSSRYKNSIYNHPSEVKPADKLRFIGWVKASEEDRSLWRDYL